MIEKFLMWFIKDKLQVFELNGAEMKKGRVKW